MKKLSFKIFVILLAAMPFFNSCQKEDDLLFEKSIDELVVPQLKSATSSSYYLYGIIESIKELVNDGLINDGICKSLVLKVENAIKSNDKDNLYALEGQLTSFINELQDHIENGIIPIEYGEVIIKKAENGIILSKGYFLDSRDGRKYKVVLIGDQIWLAENLAYLPSVSPSSQGSPSASHYYVYGYEGTDVAAAKATDNYNTYGVLYNWTAAMQACPNGWHLPSDAEWEQLAQFISDRKGPYSKSGNSWLEVGKHLKATSGWNDNGNGTDDYGFSALPGGISSYHFGNFNSIGKYSPWWSSTQYYNVLAWYRNLNFADQNFRRGVVNLYEGYSVRCVRD